MRTDILDRKDDILRWVSEKLPNTEIARRLLCKVDTLRNYYKKMGICYNGNRNRAGLKHYEQRSTIEHMLTSGRTNASKRKRLIECWIKEEKCECCGLREWMGKPIPLELHHIDFNHYNNELSNLEILCSNCHMQKHNYCNRKKIVFG